MKNIIFSTLLATLASTVSAAESNHTSAAVPNVPAESKQEATMNTIRMRDALAELVHVHFDNAGMFNKAAAVVAEKGHPDLQEKFLNFAAVKEKQAQELNAIIVANGGRAVDAKMDAKGVIMKGYVKIDAAMRGLKGLYGGVETNLNLSAKYYEKFAEVPADVKEILEKQFIADKEMLAYISTQYATLNN